MKKLHFTGLCGTAMAGVAVALKKQGYNITGSDAGVYPPMSTYLEQNGIPCQEGFDPVHLNPAPDMVVIGNAVSRGNPEAEYVLSHRMPYVSLAELVRKTLIEGNTSVVVAGTHGKTTTTALTAWILEHADRQPGYMIGGVPKNFSESCRPSSGGVFVIEGDEYDTAFFDKRSKFVHYAPDIAIINNIEFDHADIFRDLDDVKRSFRQLVNIIPGNGLLLLNGDDPNALEFVGITHTVVETFGLEETCFWRAVDITVLEQGSAFTAMRDGKEFGRFEIPFPGEFMVRNALAALAACTKLGLDVDTIMGGLQTFGGVKRRMDVLFENPETTIIDDFAHHPTAIRETLLALRARYTGRRLVAVFEPRSNTSTRRVHQEELILALTYADSVILGAVNRPGRYADSERLAPEAVVQALQEKGIPAMYIPDSTEISEYVQRNRQSGDVVVVMSNGSFGGLHQRLIAACAG